MALVDTATFIKDVFRKQNLQDVSIEYGSTGGGYIADVSTAVVHHSRGTINLFIKKHETDTAKSMSTFEINFYKQVVPKLFAVSGNMWNEVPKCYHTSDTEIILENLCADGFSLWDNLQTPLSHEYIEAVLKCYGKFHALSYALKEKEPEAFAEISKDDFEPIRFVMEFYKGSSLLNKYADMATKSFNNEVCAKTFRKLIYEGLEARVAELKADDKYDVIVQGDCWTNNFMFRKREKEIEVRMLDFQLSRKISPIVDLSYFLFTSACSEEVLKDIDKYLEIYHITLVHTLEKLGCKTDALPFSELKRLWYKYGWYGAFWSMSLNKMMTADQDELDAARTDRGLFYRFLFISRNEEVYDRRMRLIIEHMFS